MAETVVFMVIACCDRRKVEDRVIHFTSASPTLAFTSSSASISQIVPAKSFEQIVTDAFIFMDQVRDVHVDRENGEVLVSVLANAPSKDIRHAIYDRQFSLMEQFPEATFDFRLVQAE